MADHDVYVVGSINQDLMVSTPTYPQLGETVHGHHLSKAPGGKGSNQAVAAARLGACTRMIGRVGDDDAGTAMVQALSEAGVDTREVINVKGSQTGLAVVMHTDEGRNAIIAIKGANWELTPRDIPMALTGVGVGDIVTTQLEIPLPTVRSALEIGRERGAITILNAAPAEPARELLGLVTLLVVNEFEMGVVAGRHTPTPREATDAAVRLSQDFELSVVLTLGDAGAVIARAGQAVDVPPFPVNAIDSTGAGDTFVGALAAFLALGHDLPTSCRWASAAGAHACLYVGAQAGVPTQQDLADHFQIGPKIRSDS